jgi:hypothetical protein
VHQALSIVQFRRALLIWVGVVLAILVSRPATAAAYNDYFGRFYSYTPAMSLAGITGLNGLSDADAQSSAASVAPSWSIGRFSWNVGGSNPAATTSSCYFPSHQNGCGVGYYNNTPAYTYVNSSNGIISGATIYFNQGASAGQTTYVTWSNQCPMPSGDTSLPSVALHEYGHAMGLGDLYRQAAFVPWDPPDDIMGGNYGANGCTTQLGADDRDAAANLYGMRQYLPSVFSNDNGWDSLLELSTDDATVQTVEITFYTANSTYGTGVSGPFAVTIYGTGIPRVIDASSYVPTGAAYSATVDGTLPFAVVNKMFNTSGASVDSVKRVMPFDQTQGTDAWGTASSDGVTAPPPVGVGACPVTSTNSVYVPLVMNNNSGWSTTLYIMDVGPNVCDQSEEVTATFYNSSGGSASEFFNLNEDRMTALSQAGDGNVPKVGSAVISASGDLVVAVLEVHAPGNVAMACTGFSSAVMSTINYIPLAQVNNGHAGWSTGLAIQNLTGSNQTAELNIDNQIWYSSPVPPYSSISVYPLPVSGITWGSGFAVSSGALAVVANQLTANGDIGSTYSAFTNGTANDDVFPSVLTSASQEGQTWTSGLVIQNTSMATHTYYVDYYGNIDGYTLQPSQSVAWYPVPNLPTGQDVGIWVLSTDGGTHVDLLNTLVPTNYSQDYFYTYTGTMR